MEEEEKGVSEDEMVRWYHQLNGYEFEQTGRQWKPWKPGVLQSMGRQESDMTEWLNNNRPSDYNVLNHI